MASPLAFKEANVVFYPPAGMEDEVLPLHVRRCDGALVSCWQLTAEEIEEVIRTRGVVWLSVMGHWLPQVLVAGRKADVI